MTWLVKYLRQQKPETQGGREARAGTIMEGQKPASLPLWYISSASLPVCEPLFSNLWGLRWFSALYFPSSLISIFIFTPFCGSTI